MNWKTEVFRYFLEGDLKDGRTKPKGKTHGSGCHPLTWDEAQNKPLFGGILNDGFIDESYDDPEMFSVFLKMREYNHWNCLILEHKEKQTGHVIWKDSFNKIKKKSGADQKTAVGLIADIHGGYTYIRLKEPDHVRYPPLFEPETIDEIPDELLLVNTKKNLWKQRTGSGRNSELFGYIQVLQTQLFLSNDRCRSVIRSINDFVFAEPLPESELQVIVRDEAFTKYEVNPLNSINAFDLIQMDIDPVYFAVEDFLPAGLSIIASPPKFGKSYLCTQLSIAVSKGIDFLGFHTNKSGVLYMALEDSFNRCKDRLIQELQGEAPPKNLDLIIDCPTLGNGLIELLQDYIKEHPDTKLIIIDTFAKIRDGSKNNEGAYTSDYREAGLLKKFADQNGIAVLLVHHTRKMKDITDPFANISGTQGLTGACDTMIVLTKENRGDDLTRLSITGRDVYQNEYGISRDYDSGLWMRYEESIDLLMLKNEQNLLMWEYMNSNVRKTILYLLENESVWTGRCSDLIARSKEHDTYITETPQKLSKVLEKYESVMIQADHIHHSILPNGSGSGKHKFEK